jgi:CRISPR-associated protein Cas4
MDVEAADRQGDVGEPIPLSALQHAVYCLRQAALIHLERVWAENRFTAEGRVLHAVADKGGSRKARGLRRIMALPLACRRLNLVGVSDVVEFHPAPGADGADTPYPIEYKRGKPKLHRADEVQLCAQALCLEEMTGKQVPEGALFYAGNEAARRRSLRREVAGAHRRYRWGACRGIRLTPDAAADHETRTLPRLFAQGALPAGCSGKACQGLARSHGGEVALDGGGNVKKLLNTVYITTEGASLRKDGENLVAEVEGTERARVPFHMLASIVVFGGIYVSPALMAAVAASGITLVLLDRNGRFQARIEGPVTGNVLLRRAQYKASDAPLDIVRSIVIGKVMNQRSVLMRSLRDYGRDYAEADCQTIAAVTERLSRIIRRAELSDDTLDLLRGSEGEAANLYFSVFDHLIRSPDKETPLERSLTATAARSGQRALVVSLHAAHPRLPFGLRKRGARSRRGISASRPAGPALRWRST